MELGVSTVEAVSVSLSDDEAATGAGGITTAASVEGATTGSGTDGSVARGCCAGLAGTVLEADDFATVRLRCACVVLVADAVFAVAVFVEGCALREAVWWAE